MPIRPSRCLPQDGKILGMGGINDNEDARAILAWCRFVLTGSDHSYVIAGASAKAEFMRAQVNR